jgi:hypothetical protein
MSLEDLFVHGPMSDDGVGHIIGTHRPATREDVLAAVRELGGEEVWWCETHHETASRAWVDGDAKVRVCDRCDQFGNLGRVVPALIVPLDTGDTE